MPGAPRAMVRFRSGRMACLVMASIHMVPAMPCVMMRMAVTAMLGRFKVAAHERSAAAAVHDLVVGHAVASAHGALGDVNGVVALMGSVVVVPANRALVRPLRMAVRGMTMRPCRMMAAHIYPAVTWPRPRHWREWRQGWRLRLCRWRRLRPFRHGLLRRRSRLGRSGLLPDRRLLRGRLLRCDRRSENRQTDQCAGHGDTLHRSLPVQSGADGSRPLLGG